jgi:hypothetical protein
LKFLQLKVRFVVFQLFAFSEKWQKLLINLNTIGQLNFLRNIKKQKYFIQGQALPLRLNNSYNIFGLFDPFPPRFNLPGPALLLFEADADPLRRLLQLFNLIGHFGRIRQVVGHQLLVIESLVEEMQVFKAVFV